MAACSASTSACSTSGESAWPYVRQLVGGLDGVSGQGEQAAAHQHGLLSAQRVVKHARHIAVHPPHLCLGGNFVGVFLLLVDVLTKAELAPQHDGLGDEAALFPAPIGAAADLIPFVADGWIGIERSLSGQGLGAADHGRCLLQGRIVSISHGEKVLQLERGARCDALQQFGRRRRHWLLHHHAWHWVCAIRGAVHNHSTDASLLYIVFSMAGYEFFCNSEA